MASFIHDRKGVGSDEVLRKHNWRSLSHSIAIPREFTGDHIVLCVVVWNSQLGQLGYEQGPVAEVDSDTAGVWHSAVHYGMYSMVCVVN